VNRGKRSIEINMKDQKGLGLALRLIERADVLIENFAPGTASRLGIDFGALRERYPRLITVSISLWGSFDSAGDLARRGGLAIVAEAESSIMGTNRDQTGVPKYMGTPVGDLATGLAAYAAIVTALIERERTGRGQHLEIPMVRTLLALNSTAITGKQIEASAEYMTPPVGYGVYPTEDGYICLGVNSDHLWKKLCECMGRSELAADPRFATYRERDTRPEEGNAIVRAFTMSHTSQELVDSIGPTGLPCGKISLPEDVLGESDIRRMGWLLSVDDGIGGSIDVPTNAVGWIQTSNRIPHVGEHAEEILMTELGIEHWEFEQLAAEGLFGTKVKA
jgi:crotonobetainyl-CoA:carnitine CoA-transferase CaiB-like acyl-CoA transferase